MCSGCADGGWSVCGACARRWAGSMAQVDWEDPGALAAPRPLAPRCTGPCGDGRLGWDAAVVVRSTEFAAGLGRATVRAARARKVRRLGGARAATASIVETEAAARGAAGAAAAVRETGVEAVAYSLKTRRVATDLDRMAVVHPRPAASAERVRAAAANLASSATDAAALGGWCAAEAAALEAHAAAREAEAAGARGGFPEGTWTLPCHRPGCAGVLVWSRATDAAREAAASVAPCGRGALAVRCSEEGCGASACGACGSPGCADGPCGAGARAGLARTRASARACPRCGTPMEKEAETCSQVTCAGCATTFDWRTGRVQVDGALHNPSGIEGASAAGEARPGGAPSMLTPLSSEDPRGVVPMHARPSLGVMEALASADAADRTRAARAQTAARAAVAAVEAAVLADSGGCLSAAWASDPRDVAAEAVLEGLGDGDGDGDESAPAVEAAVVALGVRALDREDVLRLRQHVLACVGRVIAAADTEVGAHPAEGERTCDAAAADALDACVAALADAHAGVGVAGRAAAAAAAAAAGDAARWVRGRDFGGSDQREERDRPSGAPP